MYLQVAIDTPLRQLFDYLPPVGIDARSLRPGQRILAPFGRRRMVGILISVSVKAGVAASKLKRALQVLDDEAVFDAKLFDLLCWSGEYYRHPLGAVLAAALPAALRSGAALRAATPSWRLTAQGASEGIESLPPRAMRLRVIMSALIDCAWREADELQALHPQWREALRTLLARGYVEHRSTSEESPPVIGSVAVGVSAETAQTSSRSAAPTLNTAQQAALDALVNRLDGFHTLLLNGVTGSGKTEVYLRAIETVIQRGRQALVLAPEIALTPQLVARFEARLASPVAVLHSSRSDGERLAAWRAARSGAAAVVIGTRSAIFAPLARPGLIIVDEEHDASYKQQEGFRYSARDLAIVRAQRHGVPVVLGSATPSLESMLRATRQPATFLRLPERAGEARPPQLKLIDVRQHGSQQGLSTPVMLAIRRHLDANGQVLLYLNRRGYAPVLFCPNCGWAAPCTRCDARLTMHRRKNLLLCHHCGHEERIPATCPACQTPTKPVGQGTERIEETLAQLYPDAPLARIDRDSVSRKGALDAALERVNSGEVKILVGTQMLSKGHDFPNVTLAVILDADQGLFSTDFRASERLAQSILQVAGRAGRGAKTGEVLIQTEYPEHPLLHRLLDGGYPAFVDAALHERRSASWPPYSRLALLRAEAARPEIAKGFLQTVSALAQRRTHDVKILGPAPAPMSRRAGMHRAQLLLQAATHTPLQQLLAKLIPEMEKLPDVKRVRWSVDVDPAELF